MHAQLFPTCLIDSLFPEVAQAVCQVLSQASVNFILPDKRTCCGQPAMNAGFREDARQIARHTLQLLSASPDPVVIPSGSCAAMIKHGYLELFADDPVWEPIARDVSSRTYEFTQFLVDLLNFDATGSSHRGPLHYFPSCHTLRGLGIDQAPSQLLNSVQGIELHRLPAECCGFGGVFALEFAEISTAMLERTLRTISATEALVIVGTDVSCLMHLEGGLRRNGSQTRCSHIAQILANQPPGLR